MAPSSPTFFGRLGMSPKGPLLPIHNFQKERTSTDYDLDELEPRPTDSLLPVEGPELIQRRKPRRDSDQAPFESSTGADADIEDSPPRSRRVLFSGPPPPIARSVLLARDTDASSPPLRSNPQARNQNITSSLLNIGSVFFDNRRTDEAAYDAPPDSIWRNLRQREKAIEDDLQEALDMQAVALSGRPGLSSPGQSGTSDFDVYSDGGSSTPTGTFYSTASSKSRMKRSLNIPINSTPEGNVIPVRQPRRSRRVGIRTVRQALLRSMTALADLKVEEDARVASAISKRKVALARLRKLAVSRQTITSELETLDGDEEEPLGKELRQLESKRSSLTTEIRELEERLVGLRNKRRWVDDRIDDVRNRREAGLSGYKGALREVEANVATLMRRPPVRPLDSEFWESHGDTGIENGFDPSPGGEEFLRLIPERRTLDMAKAWWEAEIRALEYRRKQVERDREALESGEQLWSEVIDLVTNYESGLADLMKGKPSNRKGKEPAPNDQNIGRKLESQMSGVITSLEEKLQTAEGKGWTLLICAIGAELDTFMEAQKVLRQGLGPNSESGQDSQGQLPDQDFNLESTRSATESPAFKPSIVRRGSGSGSGSASASVAQKAESDDEVPQELLASTVDPFEGTPRAMSPAMKNPPVLNRSDSENSVPPEFLAEHEPDEDAVD